MRWWDELGKGLYRFSSVARNDFLYGFTLLSQEFLSLSSNAAAAAAHNKTVFKSFVIFVIRGGGEGKKRFYSDIFKFYFGRKKSFCIRQILRILSVFIFFRQLLLDLVGMWISWEI
jgi:hypothetical protein